MFVVGIYLLITPSTTAFSTGTELVPIPSAALNLGELRGGEAHHVNFVLHNQGNRRVIVETIETTCSCTAAEIELPIQILPQGKLDVIIVWTPANVEGGQKQSAAIKYTEGGTRRVGFVTFYANIY